jgi:hypothetical protein
MHSLKITNMLKTKVFTSKEKSTTVEVIIIRYEISGESYYCQTIPTDEGLIIKHDDIEYKLIGVPHRNIEKED